MTRKHFEQAAEIVKLNVGKAHKIAAFEAFVMFFRLQNPRFDIERFRTACGLE